MVQKQENGVTLIFKFLILKNTEISQHRLIFDTNDFCGAAAINFLNWSYNELHHAFWRPDATMVPLREPVNLGLGQKSHYTRNKSKTL